MLIEEFGNELEMSGGTELWLRSLEEEEVIEVYTEVLKTWSMPMVGLLMPMMH